METWEGQGLTKSLSRSSCPQPPPSVAQCWALPGGNPFNVSAIPLPGVPSASPPDPCCLFQGWSLRLDLGSQRINRKGGGD